jgi:hypothetical protein
MLCSNLSPGQIHGERFVDEGTLFTGIYAFDLTGKEVPVR